MKRVDKIVVDSLAQCVKIGEVQHALAQGIISEDTIHAEIGQILVGEKNARERDNEVTLFDSTGIAAQDIAAAKIVFEQALKKGLGQYVNFLDG